MRANGLLYFALHERQANGNWQRISQIALPLPSARSWFRNALLASALGHTQQRRLLAVDKPDWWPFGQQG